MPPDADVGLLHRLMRTPSVPTPGFKNLSPQVRGQLTEQVVGQQLRALKEPYEEPQLYYWQREGGRPGKIDFLAQHQDRIVPVELKSGAAGSMKSLHQFMYDKHLALAVRFDANPPSSQDLDIKTTRGQPVRYKLISLPHYMAASLKRLITEL